jgi:rRNA processing protein Krr1/Pno1
VLGGERRYHRGLCNVRLLHLMMLRGAKCDATEATEATEAVKAVARAIQMDRNLELLYLQVED